MVPNFHRFEKDVADACSLHERRQLTDTFHLLPSMPTCLPRSSSLLAAQWPFMSNLKCFPLQSLLHFSLNIQRKAENVPSGAV